MSEPSSQSYSSYSNEEALLSENPRGDYIIEEVMDHSGGSYCEEEEIIHDQSASSHSGETGSQSQSYQSSEIEDEDDEDDEEQGSCSIVEEETDESSSAVLEVEGEHSFAQDSYAETYRVHEVLAASTSAHSSSSCKSQNQSLSESLQQEQQHRRLDLPLSLQNNNSSLYQLGSIKWSDDDDQSANLSLLTGDAPSVMSATLVDRWNDADEKKNQNKLPPSERADKGNPTLGGSSDDETDDEEEELIAEDVSSSSYVEEEEETFDEDEYVMDEVEELNDSSHSGVAEEAIDEDDTMPLQPQRQVSIATHSYSSLFSSGTLSSTLESESFLNLVKSVEEDDSTKYDTEDEASCLVLTNPTQTVLVSNQQGKVQDQNTDGNTEEVVRRDTGDSCNKDVCEATESRQQEVLEGERVDYSEQSESSDLDMETHSLSQRSG